MCFRFFFFGTVLWTLTCATQTPGPTFDAVQAYRHGIEHGAKGEIQTAVVLFEKAVSLEPKFAEAWYNLAIGYEKLKEGSRAVIAYQKALEVDPDFYEARVGIADRYIATGQMDLAALEYERIIAKDDNYPEINYRLAQIYASRNDFPRAEALMNRVFFANPFHVKSLSWAAKYSLSKGQFARSAELASHIIELDSTDETAWLIRFDALWSQGNRDLARTQIQAALVQFSKSKAVHSRAKRAGVAR